MRTKQHIMVDGQDIPSPTNLRGIEPHSPGPSGCSIWQRYDWVVIYWMRKDAGICIAFGIIMVELQEEVIIAKAHLVW